MLKNWFLLTSVSCGVGFGSTFLISRNLQQSAWAGLGTVPAVAASMTILSRQRKEEIERQVAKLRSSLDSLEGEERLAKDRLQLTQSSHQQIDRQVQGLRSEQAKLATISTELAQIEARRQLAIDSAEQSDLELQSICNKIHQYYATQKRIELEISRLQSQWHSLQSNIAEREVDRTKIGQQIYQLEDRRDRLLTAVDDLDRLLQEKQALLQNLDLDRERKTIIGLEISSLLQQKQEHQVLLGELEKVIYDKQTIILDVDTTASSKERQLARIAIALSQIEAERELAIDSTQQSDLALQKIRDEISQHSATKDRLEVEIAEIYNQYKNLQIEITNRDSDCNERERKICQLEEQQDRRSNALDNLNESLAEREIILQGLDLNLNLEIDRKRQIGENIDNGNRLSDDRQVLLPSLDLEINNWQQIKQESEFKINIIDNLSSSLNQKSAPILEVTDANKQECKEVKSQIKEKLKNIHERTQPHNLDFTDPNYISKMWREQILPFWLDRDKPEGQRFLGNVRIERSKSDEILAIVGENFSNLEYIANKSIQANFSRIELDWINIFTFAVSEYAYYYSGERFWEGLCDRWGIEATQGVEKILRNITEKGIKKLGLVKAYSGHKYVSTLWLQSGVPYRNLEWFAQLLQEVADEYGWLELANSSPEDIARELLQWCTRRHRQWRTLIHFFEASYSDNQIFEPMSGKLVRGIAIIAKELERQQISSLILKDEDRRQNILGDRFLSGDFFLRDWDALIQILTPRPGNNHRGIASRRAKEPYLYLDMDSGNIQLILPEQTIWKQEWKDLRGTYCEISEFNWEETFPKEGDLEIPELILDVTEDREDWNIKLINHHRNFLYTWQYKLIDRHLPCLIFDAISGEHLPIDLVDLQVVGTKQVICFAPKDIEISFDRDIEVIDDYVSSSIKGWKGQKVRLTAPKSEIDIKVIPYNELKRITWQLQKNLTPHLTGLRLKNTKSTYFESPTLWYPPLDINSRFEFRIVDLDTKTNIHCHNIDLPSSNWWKEIPLDLYLVNPGNYEVHLCNEQQQWSDRFDLKPKYQILESPELIKVQIHINYKAVELPILPNRSESTSEFWASIVQIEGLWTLEQVNLILSNGTDDPVSCPVHADPLGNLEIKLSTLSELVTESDRYDLAYQRYGFGKQCLLKMRLNKPNITWVWLNKELVISGLKSDKPYNLSYWNLLLPSRESVKVLLPLVQSELENLSINPELSTGIYYVRLLNIQEEVEAKIGFCYIGERTTIPEEVLDNDILENYCYTILGNESIEDFKSAVDALDLSFDIDLIKEAIDSLETSKEHLLPEWLDRTGLVKKLQYIVSRKLDISDLLTTEEALKVSKKSDIQPIISHHELAPIEGSWYLITVKNRRRDDFIRCLSIDRENGQLCGLIQQYKIPKNNVYQDNILVCFNNFAIANSYLQNIQHFESISRNRVPQIKVERMTGT